jgi:2-polyprenyl-3-methyl-5-hydroxy-6-metoxy-1,4-benzoquinol methylase
MSEALEQFNEATYLVNENRLEEALEIFLELEKNPEYTPFCHYRIAQISNMVNEPEEAYSLYYKALEAMPNIASRLLSKEYTGHTYVYKGKKKEKENKVCTLCGGESTVHWCYPLFEAHGFNEALNPIRMWMYCASCHHMFARSFPEKLFLHNTAPRNAIHQYFAYYSNVLSGIRRSGFATGMSLFEVGIGACECLLAAREIGYETYGIDVIERHVEDAKTKYNIDAETADFLEYTSDRVWDIVMMGDVLEHVSDPDLALSKAESMLADDGALWISTPSFESAYSCVAGHHDPMRRQQFHLNYFSRESLYMLLERNYLVPVDYQISAHYNGSMEIVAVKASRS